MKKRVLALSLLLAFSSVASAAVPKTLRIGNDPTYPPFESKNAQGQLVGFDIDLANEICKRIAAQCTYVESDFDALIPSLKAKNRFYYLFALDHGKTPAGDRLLRKTLRGQRAFSGAERL